MDFAFSEDQLAIKDSVAKLCAQFDDKYWLKKDKEGGFPEDFYQAMADAGWLGIAMPEAYGGAGLGITEAAILMQAVAESGAALQGASAIHLNIFGPNPIVVFGTEEQKKRILPDIIKGKVKGCFAVTEPDAGLNTTALDTRAERRGVEPGIGLGDGEAAFHLALDDVGQDALLLLLGAEHHDGVGSEDVEVDGRGALQRGARFGHGLHQDRRLGDAEA